MAQQYYLGADEGSGRRVSRKIIRGIIEHNGKKPDFELRGEALRVTLYA